VKGVTVEKKLHWNVRAPQSWYYDPLRPAGTRTFRVAAFDFGIKWNILRLLVSFGMDVLIVPASTPAGEIERIAPDGVFLSNGPGDPEMVPYAAGRCADWRENFRSSESAWATRSSAWPWARKPTN